MSNWYRMSADAVIAELDTNPQAGLSSDEAARRQAQYGPNELVEKGAKSPWLILLDQFKDTMVIILIIAALVSLFLGEIEEVFIILAIVVLNAVIGFSQEYRAEQAIAALRKLAVPEVTVLRDGRLQNIPAANLVPGDVLKLETGDLVSADGRLIESASLRAEEAALTGESAPVGKSVAAVTADSTDEVPLGDRRDMVYMGTAVTYGRGTAVITETGMQTELGNIAEMIQGVVDEQTPLQRRLDGLGKVLGWVSFGIIALVVVLGLLRGEQLQNLFLVGVSMAVAAVPEGLPAVVTITLALGAQRMLKRNALIRRLPAVETLGSVTVICSDKTGTLTQNRMTVTLLDVAGRTQAIETLLTEKGMMLGAETTPEAAPTERTLSLLVKSAALCNDAVIQVEPEGGQRVIGDPTEGALVVAAADLGLSKTELEADFPRVAEAPFTSERKRMTTVHALDRGNEQKRGPWGDAPYVAFCKGAVDGLMGICRTVWTGDELVPLTPELEARILEANERSAGQGQRVLGVAFRPLDALPADGDELDIEQDMSFVGLVSMMDPPRPEVRAAVERSRSAGIKPMMITGDHPLTAKTIAQDLTMATDEAPITGQQLAMMTPEELNRMVEKTPVFARVSPEHKLSIVEALQEKGHIVAMTGDGVNDAPALKRADIGVAMGITGTDVSKEAADMVLLDDNFATIVAAIEEGRNIYDNIRKFISYTLSSNTGELFVMFVGPFLGMPLPLLAVQILWINLVTDGLPGLALAVEPPERGIMSRSPHSPTESILSRGLGSRILWIGMLMGLVSLGMGYWYFLQDPNGPWQTMIFTTLTLAQMGNALALRSDKQSLFTIGLFSNRLMVLAVTITFVLQLLLIYTAFGQRFFGTEALSLRDLGISLVASSAVFIAVEIQKWVSRRSRAAGNAN
jgi:Ca2+-transporting ATPase